MRRVRAILPHGVTYPDPIRAVAGDRVTLGRRDDEYPGWVWCRATDGREGWVPVALLDTTDGTSAVLQTDYQATELAITPGEELSIQECLGGWCWVTNSLGEQGWIPETCVEPI